jgi:integrase
MAPRQRKDPRLPDGLRERDGYYSYTNPHDGREYGIGRDRRAAIQQAMEANAALKRRPTLLERITGAAKSWGEWCDEFEKILDERDAKPNTRRSRKSQLKRLRSIFPAGAPAAGIDTLQCAEALKALKAEGKARTAQAFRSFLIDCFDRMVAQGWRKDNPARVTDEVTVKVNRSRLSLELLLKVYESTQSVRLRNAIALALITGQPRESVCAARVADIHDGGWWNERGKTGARIFLPLELRLDCFGMSLGDVVKQCRSTGVLSHWLIHQTERGAWKRPGARTHVDQLTREFTEEITKLGIDWAGKHAPTFHEIRSLSSRLYKQQGNVNPQELLGHKDPRTTAVYTDGRGEWVKVSIKS